MESDILILFYNTMFGVPLEYSSQELPAGCSITTDRTLLKQADAVVFHLPDLFRVSEEDEIEKPEGQLWVAWSLECEVNYPWVERKEFCELFDLRMGYHDKDDIVYSYCKYSYLEKLKQPDWSRSKENKVCMFVSSWVNQSHRQEYLYELMKYTSVDSYGSLYNNRKLPVDRGAETLLEVIKDYKFVIAFENAIAPDYVTEKFYNPLIVGTVPVYLGAPNIHHFSPGENCFIDVSLYKDPRLLAEFINRCYADDSLYNSFYEWKSRPLLQEFNDWIERERIDPIVRLCRKVQQMKTGT